MCNHLIVSSVVIWLSMASSAKLQFHRRNLWLSIALRHHSGIFYKLISDGIPNHWVYMHRLVDISDLRRQQFMRKWQMRENELYAALLKIKVLKNRMRYWIFFFLISFCRSILMILMTDNLILDEIYLENFGINSMNSTFEFDNKLMKIYCNVRVRACERCNS